MRNAVIPSRLCLTAAIALAALQVLCTPATAQVETTPGSGAGTTVGGGTAAAPTWAFWAGKGAQILSSPAIGSDRAVYVGVSFKESGKSGAVLAVLPNGAPKWTKLSQGMFRTPDGAIESAPVLSNDGRTLYVGCKDGILYALNTDDGSVRWTFPTGMDHSIFGSPAVGADGTVYFGSSNLVYPADSTFWAVSSEGKPRWARSAGDWFESSPAVAADGTVYYGSLDGILYARTPEGVEKWRYDTGGLIYTSPAIASDGTVYVGSDAGDFLAISSEGVKKWSARIFAGAGASIGADGTVYVGTIDSATSGSMYAFTPHGTLKPKWPVRFSGSIESVPAVLADGTIVFGGADRKIHALNPDGTEKWYYDVGDAVYSSVAPDSDGTFYVGATNGRLYSFPGWGSGLSTYSSWPMFGRDVARDGRAHAKIGGGRLVNLATRGQAAPGPNLIAGLVVQGSGFKKLLVRAVGPSLRLYGVSNALPNPKLTMRVDTAAEVNDDWGDERPDNIRNAAAEVGAFPLVEKSKDAAVLAFTTVGSVAGYTAVVESVDQQPGVALVEVYDANVSVPEPRLVNLSTRGYAGGGENVLIGGLVIGGSGKLRVLIRGIGPALQGLGVPNPLPRPVIKVFDESTVLLASNTGWTSGGLKGDLAAAFGDVGAFPLSETSADSALIATLSPGAYTVQLSGVNGDVGEGLVEVYAIPE